MTDLNTRNFGLIIAYLLPGFVALCGLATISPFVRDWLLGASIQGPTVGGFLYVLLASVAAGMTLAALRWAILDSIHHATGIKRPNWNDAALENRLAAFQYVVENHYMYYQFYGNTLIAILFSYLIWRFNESRTFSELIVFDLATLAIQCVFAAGSRDALRRYYQRTANLLGNHERKEVHDERQSPNTNEDRKSQPKEKEIGKRRKVSADSDANED